MPKRQPKPEPITPEEVMGSPALQGFDTFLRYRTVDQPEAENGGAGESASGESAGQARTGRIASRHNTYRSFTSWPFTPW